MKAAFSKVIETGASGVYRCHSALAEAALGTAAQRGMRVEKVALAGARDKNAFLNAVAQALVFPDYFGHNWDAFYDCLVDLEHDKGEGLLVVLRDASGLDVVTVNSFTWSNSSRFGVKSRALSRM